MTAVIEDADVRLVNSVQEVEAPLVVHTERVGMRLKDQFQSRVLAPTGDLSEQADVGVQTLLGISCSIILSPGVMADEHTEIQVSGEFDRGAKTIERRSKLSIRQDVHPAVKSVQPEALIGGPVGERLSGAGRDQFVEKRGARYFQTVKTSLANPLANRFDIGVVVKTDAVNGWHGAHILLFDFASIVEHVVRAHNVSVRPLESAGRPVRRLPAAQLVLPACVSLIAHI